ncbi:neutral cholesterol ester hydrolase 1-like protein [Cricetulus griseus]|uniref:Neutral cholesterol ester hydrolase 1-like protein n=1 Tax=Cricetulus griseus TaxID=10029 RepID=A0A061IBF7_CRIGR|nr:neutral cholesterol ester hydrolase 1-like protein [Cricetulus griseus]
MQSHRGGPPDQTHTLWLRAYGSPDEQGQQPLRYWQFSAADLYNWKTQNPPFSDNPQALTNLIGSLLFTHQPTWDDCQQLLQVLFTTEERQHNLLEARKNVPGPDGRPSLLPDVIEASFPLTRPDWDYNTAEGRGHLKVYYQTLMAGLRGTARQPTNLAKVREVVQGPTETPAAFLERLIEVFHQFTPYDPTSEAHKATVTVAFINQSSRDIRKKLQKLEGLQDKSLRDLVQVAENVYHNRDTEEEKEERKQKEQEAREFKWDKRQRETQDFSHCSEGN